MSQNESTTVLVTDAKNLTLIDATRENSPWCNKKVRALKWSKSLGFFLVIWSKLPYLGFLKRVEPILHVVGFLRKSVFVLSTEV